MAEPVVLHATSIGVCPLTSATQTPPQSRRRCASRWRSGRRRTRIATWHACSRPPSAGELGSAAVVRCVEWREPQPGVHAHARRAQVCICSLFRSLLVDATWGPLLGLGGCPLHGILCNVSVCRAGSTKGHPHHPIHDIPACVFLPVGTRS